MYRQKILNDVFETGSALQDDSNAKQSSSCDDSKPQPSSRESHVSKQSSCSTDVSQGRKRELSPPKLKTEEFE
jgi:hypothetical protein